MSWYDMVNRWIFSKEVISMVIVERQNSDHSAPAMKQNEEDDKANDASGSVGDN